MLLKFYFINEQAIPKSSFVKRARLHAREFFDGELTFAICESIHSTRSSDVKLGRWLLKDI